MNLGKGKEVRYGRIAGFFCACLLLFIVWSCSPGNLGKITINLESSGHSKMALDSAYVKIGTTGKYVPLTRKTVGRTTVYYLVLDSLKKTNYFSKKTIENAKRIDVRISEVIYRRILMYPSILPENPKEVILTGGELALFNENICDFIRTELGYNSFVETKYELYRDLIVTNKTFSQDNKSVSEWRNFTDTIVVTQRSDTLVNICRCCINPMKIDSLVSP